MLAPLELSEEARRVIAAEREAVAARVADLRRQSESLQRVMEQIDADFTSAERLLRRMDEMLGLGHGGRSGVTEVRGGSGVA